MAIELQSLIIEYWRNSPRLLGITNYRQRLKDSELAAAQAILNQRDCTQAEGIWLDLIGGLLGLERPATRDPQRDPRFGFDEAGVAFDQEPFTPSGLLGTRFPIGDDPYCRLLQARGVTLMADGTKADLTRALAYLDPAATVTDDRQGTVTLHTGEPSLVQLALEHDALPVALGVSTRVTGLPA